MKRIISFCLLLILIIGGCSKKSLNEKDIIKNCMLNPHLQNTLWVILCSIMTFSCNDNIYKKDEKTFKFFEKFGDYCVRGAGIGQHLKSLGLKDYCKWVEELMHAGEIEQRLKLLELKEKEEMALTRFRYVELSLWYLRTIVWEIHREFQVRCITPILSFKNLKELEVCLMQKWSLGGYFDRLFNAYVQKSLEPPELPLERVCSESIKIIEDFYQGSWIECFPAHMRK